MSAEKTTDHAPWCGKTLPCDLGRDAIHVATISVRVSSTLVRGEGVRFVDAGLKPAPVYDAHGIVDPFLDGETVPPNTWVLVFLKPGTISSLRHVWTHPALPDQPVDAGAAGRLKRLAEGAK